jgi:ubiquinone/menaquinone biosynthesis C-methylase UbiE
MQDSLSWWDKNVGSNEMFKGWVKGKNVPSRKFVRDYIKSKYKSVIDFGAGLCEDYYALLEENAGIHYNAVDFTDRFVASGKYDGIKIYKESVEKTHFEDKVVDVAYCRHVLEHLPYYEKAIDEMIRVSMKEIIVTFFFPPKDKEEIRLNNGLNHNIYSKKKIEEYLWKNERVVNVEWNEFSDKETILFVKLC